MTTFTITPGTSVKTTGVAEHAFNADTPAGDALIVQAGAYLIAESAYARGAILNGIKPWKVTVAGEIASEKSEALLLGQGQTGNSTITIASTGVVGGGQTGIALHSAAAIVNAGEIFGADVGIMLAGTDKHSIRNTGDIHAGEYSILDAEGFSADMVENAGKLYGRVALSGGDDRLTNSGDISGAIEMGSGENTLINSGVLYDSVTFGNGNNTLVNSGEIDKEVTFGEGNNNFTNSGNIFDDVTFGAGNDTIRNSGIVNDNFNLGRGNNVLTNSGSILFGVYGDSGNDTVTNSKLVIDLYLDHGNNTITNKGTIEGRIEVGAGNDTITNSGRIAAAIMLGNGDNRLTNSGTMDDNIYGGSGKDIVTNSGTMLGHVHLGAGDDVFTGGNGTEIVWDDAGSDTIKFGGGNDFYYAAGLGSDGTDTIDGGAGIDGYEAGGATRAVYINLDTVAHDLSPFSMAGYVTASTATGDDVAGAFKDTIKGFENAYGGTADDIIYGSAADNLLEGNAGYDTLFGYGGNDTLRGGSGGDSLYGGTGRDILTGGAGSDYFLFAAITDSGLTAATRDTISDFEDGIDLINLNHIDANTKNGAADDAFTFIGTNQAFTGTAGELRAVLTTEGQLVEGDVNGDGKADFSIGLTDPSHLITLLANDFVL